MKRIALLLVGGVRPSTTGPTVPALVDLVRALSESFEIVVFTLIGPDSREDTFHLDGAVVRTIPCRYDVPLLVRTWKYLQCVAREYHSKPFDAIHGFWGLPCGLAAVLLGKRLRIPSVVTLMGGEVASIPGIGYGNMTRVSTRRLTTWVCKHASRVICLTEFQSTQLTRFQTTCKAPGIIPFGANTRFYSEPRTTSASEPYKFLHVGDINPVKNQEMLLRTFKILAGKRDCHLRVIGADFLGGKMQTLANHYGLADKAEFLGYLPHDSLPSHFAWADIMLHTSLYESEAVSVAEAAAAGVVVCGTRVGLLSDLGDDCCVTVSGDDEVELATRILRVLDNPAEYLRLRANARSWADGHTSHCTAKSYTGVYRACIG